MRNFWCERAWLPDGVASRVLVEVDGGTIVSVSTVDTIPLGAERLYGLVLPGFANTHSHAFHRGLRGRTHADGGTFWTWRESMYALAGKLTPRTYFELARAVYAEMAVTGVTSVGEFHYLHDGADDMADALRAAAEEVGLRLTLLTTCYLTGGIGRPLEGVQRRFTHGTVENWQASIARQAGGPLFRAGGAIHSVRAVPRAAVADIAAAFPDRPLHVHLSEQPAENEDCLAAYGLTPTGVLAEAGALGPRTTAVHATHLTDEDIALLGGSGTTISLCPTTEADLADGIGPARALADAGSPLALGSDQHAVIDLLLEARSLEYGERLRSGRRGNFTPAELVGALTDHAAVGWPTAGRIEVGAAADFTAVRLDTARTAGTRPDQVVLTASAPDVSVVVVHGRVIARDGVHETLGDVPRLLTRALEAL
ncbi:formimidoylglutamate deiminase [Saccharothrix violaceirubra]|uniref:Formiminoglutamate deiminase n=1 Tax=Saccharothrix violaceirubra TaxID=413306 RepID=A0A7W7SZL2_9PSEU|nr:formimidoylglutamate deiminase [Saccharothrix violaceirubra]MBB4963252.1 formiminoglutamate deiminase [Saccharothrix violaceirubra]